jgi:hypothetical protein
MNYYGYIKTNGTTPRDNVWKSGRTITLNNNSTLEGYEGKQSTSDSNVEIIGDSKAFTNWMKENTPQEKNI